MRSSFLKLRCYFAKLSRLRENFGFRVGAGEIRSSTRYTSSLGHPSLEGVENSPKLRSLVSLSVVYCYWGKFPTSYTLSVMTACETGPHIELSS